MLDDNTAHERAARLKRLRTICGLTQIELTQKIGCGPLTISYWEKGVLGGINEHAAEKIISGIKNIVECKIEWLLNGEGEAPRLIA